ncbi:hypothetical protein, partial [Natrinema soli]
MNTRPLDSDTDGAALRSFVDQFERGERHAAVQTLLETADEPRSILTSLFGVGYDGWYALVADDISGSCLDLSPGWGRTTPLLSRLADTVYTYQPTDTGSRLLEARPALEGADVVSIAADDLASAVRGRSFETIVTTGPRAPDGDFFDHVDGLAPSLEDGGTLITEINGWPRTTGVTDLVASSAGRRRPAIDPRRPSGNRFPRGSSRPSRTGDSTKSNCSACSLAGVDTVGQYRSPTPTPSSGCWTRSKQTRRPLGCSEVVQPSPTGWGSSHSRVPVTSPSVERGRRRRKRTPNRGRAPSGRECSDAARTGRSSSNSPAATSSPSGKYRTPPSTLATTNVRRRPSRRSRLRTA